MENVFATNKISLLRSGRSTERQRRPRAPKINNRDSYLFDGLYIHGWSTLQVSISSMYLILVLPGALAGTTLKNSVDLFVLRS